MTKPVIAYDVETTGLYPHSDAKMFAYSLCDEEGNTSVQRLDGSPLRQKQGARKLQEVWSDKKKRSEEKVAHNAKFDIAFTEKFLGKRLRGHTVHCTHKMSHILQNNHPGHSLDNLAWELAEYPRIDGSMRRLAKMCGGYHKVPERKMNEYQALDTERDMLLYLFFYPKIKKNKKFLEIYNTEIDLIWTTVDMERRGMLLHVPRTKKMIKDLQVKVDNIREKLFSEVGRRFNFRSDNELRKVLFQQYGLPVVKKTKKGKQPSTDKHVLLELREKYNHPVINYILQLRSYTKGITTVEDYLDIADADGIIHTTINTCAAVTGRQSSEHPNLQNVQKSGVLLNPYPVLARDCFRPRPGYINIHIDYSGIEMRLLIEVSQEREMIDCLLHGDGDVHSLAAAVLYESLFTEERDDKRRSTLRGSGKNTNFAKPYGAGTAKVAQTLGLKLLGKTMADAIKAVKRYEARFPKLSNLNKTISKQVLATGFVETNFGRKLYVPRDKPYMGTNYVIQGTAAGVLKRAQNRVHRYNIEKTGGEVKLLLPIHDEIVLEYPRKMMPYLPDYLRDVRKLMIDFPQFDVPLDVEAEVVTSSWEHKRKIPILN